MPLILLGSHARPLLQLDHALLFCLENSGLLVEHDGEKVFYRDIGSIFLDADGNIPTDIMSDGLHPTPKGYELWGDAIDEPLKALL